MLSLEEGQREGRKNNPEQREVGKRGERGGKEVGKRGRNDQIPSALSAIYFR